MLRKVYILHVAHNVSILNLSQSIRERFDIVSAMVVPFSYMTSLLRSALFHSGKRWIAQSIDETMLPQAASPQNSKTPQPTARIHTQAPGLRSLKPSFRSQIPHQTTSQKELRHLQLQHPLPPPFPGPHPSSPSPSASPSPLSQSG